MTAPVQDFALIGRSFPSDKFIGMQTAVLAARAERRARRGERMVRTWRPSQDAIVLPKKLSA